MTAPDQATTSDDESLGRGPSEESAPATDGTEAGRAGEALPSRAEALAALEDGRRLYRVAEFVQARRAPGGVDSAVTAQRALTMVLRLLVRLNGETPPDRFAELIARVRTIAEREKLLTTDHADDLERIAQTRQRLFDEGAVSAAEDRDYDRALLRSAEWFGAVDAFVRQKLTKPVSSGSGLAIFGGVLLIFALGVLAGRQIRAKGAPMAQGSAAAGPSAGIQGPAFTATFFRDTVFSEPALTRRDGSIAFDWGSKAPTESLPSDNFAVRWEGTLFISTPGKYVFYLTSDDGSRFALDGNLIIDNWGSHAEHTEDASVELSEGSHKVRVEFFDKVGPAVIRFEWSSQKFARRLVTSADLI